MRKQHPHEQMSKRAECFGKSLIVNTASCEPSDSPLQKSVIRLERVSLKEMVCGVSPKLSRQTISLLPFLILPTRNESSSKRAASPVGGCSLRNIPNRSALIFVRSSPDRSMPPVAK